MIKQITKKQEWDNFVTSLDRYTFVQSWEYLNVLKALCERVERFGVYDRDKLKALIPIGVIRAKRGHYLRFRHGPILDFNDPNYKKYFKEILEFSKSYCLENNLNFLRIQMLHDGDLDFLSKEGFIYSPTHNLDAEHTLQLDLSCGDRELLKNMRKNTRYYIRKSEKTDIQIRKVNNQFDKFYKILKDTAERQHYNTWPKEYFESLFKYFSEQELSLYMAFLNDEECGMGLFLDYGKYRFYLEGGMYLEYGKYYPSYTIQWQSIQDAVAKDLKIYDFWGGVTPVSAGENYPWRGIDTFKRGFGGTRKAIMHPYDKPYNWKYWGTYLFERYEKWRRNY